MDPFADLAGISTNPSSAWDTQQARQLVWKLEKNNSALHFLIRDREKKFTNAFDNVFIAAGFHVIHTPLWVPDVNAYAERCVRIAREECPCTAKMPGNPAVLAYA